MDMLTHAESDHTNVTYQAKSGLDTPFPCDSPTNRAPSCLYRSSQRDGPFRPRAARAHSTALTVLFKIAPCQRYKPSLPIKRPANATDLSTSPKVPINVTIPNHPGLTLSMRHD